MICAEKLHEIYKSVALNVYRVGVQAYQFSIPVAQDIVVAERNPLIVLAVGPRRIIPHTVSFATDIAGCHHSFHLMNICSDILLSQYFLWLGFEAATGQTPAISFVAVFYFYSLR